MGSKAEHQVTQIVVRADGDGSDVGVTQMTPPCARLTASSAAT